MNEPKQDAHLIEHTLDHVEVLKGHFLHAFRDQVRLPMATPPPVSM